MAGTVIADNLQAASTSQLVIKNGVASTPPTIQDSAGTQIGTFCRAWVSFNGTGTVAIRASFNVTSITDNGTGDYTVNFTTAMPDANYCYQLATTEQSGATGNNGINAQLPTAILAGSIRVLVRQSATAYDSESVSAAIFR
jgi:hypothetical protein